MDFESPDVEKDFPGLYASESGRKSNESDCKYACWECVMSQPTSLIGRLIIGSLAFSLKGAI